MHLLKITNKSLGELLGLSISLTVLIVFLFSPNLAFADEGPGYFEGAMLELLWNIVVGVFGLFVGIAGIILNAGINLFVINFGLQYTESGLGLVVDQVWVYIRDIFNLTFIFGLLYIGFKLILDSSNSNTKRWLVNLILAALLVNFSLFITKFVIDFSNIAATQLATSGFEGSIDPEAANWLQDLVPGGNGEWYDVAGEYAEAMGLPTIYGGAGSGEIIGENTETVPSSLGYIFGSMVLFIVAAIVFAAGGLMLIVRFVVLNIYMLLSPVMFIGWVFPQFIGLTNSYWKGFLGQAFLAPAYILMMYFAFRLLNGYGLEREQNLAGIFNSNVGDTATANIVGSFTFFIVVCGFLVAAIVVSKKLSEMGANGTMGAVSAVNNKIIRTTRRAVETPSRKIGRVAASPVTGAASGARALGAYGARTSTAALGRKLDSGLRRIQQGQGVVAGKVAKVARGLDRPVGRAARQMQDAQFGTGRTAAQATSESNAVLARSKRERSLRLGTQAQDRIDRNKSKDLAADQTAVNEMQQAAANITAKQFEDMTREQQEALAGNINESTFTSVMEGDSMNEEAKANILGARRTAIEKNLKDGREVLSGEIEKLSVNQIETLGEDFVRENAHLFTDKQIEGVEASKNFTSTQKGNFREKRKANFDAAISSNKAAGFLKSKGRDATGVVVERSKKANEVATLPKEVLKDPSVAKDLDSSMLRAISKRDDLTIEDRKEIETAVAGNLSNSDGNNYFGSPHHANNW